MIDFHTHILPGIDDGSKNSKMSVEMLQRLKGEGVTDVVLSPHFYASQNSVEKFLSRRSVGLEHLQAALDEYGQPIGLKLHLGAEILFMDSLDKVDELEAMAIGHTDCILLEMPFAKWSTRNLDTVYKIKCNGFNVVIAHFERYLGFGNGNNELDELQRMGCVLQMNSASFNGFFARRKSVKLFASGRASLIGSDCHNLDGRPPKVKEAYDAVGEKLGSDAVERIISLGHKLLENSSYIQV